MTALGRLWPALLAAIILCSCSSPSPVLYTISPVSGAEHHSGPKVVSVRQIGLARYLERPQIVRSSENFRLDVLSNDWWGEPLNTMLARVLVQELAQRLPNSTVLNEGGAISSDTPDASVEVNIERLDLNATGQLVLLSQAAVSFRGKGGQVLRSYRFSVTPPSSGPQGEVAAISSAIGQLADGLATTLSSSRPVR
ncbi:MAG: membrane integrity-associated transporter subunit PqiC [Acetobacteraceae bacterium]|nr:membrane integrity-associated transporter subunit PqiC [Acetobacteraceae bacterium]